MGHFSLALSIFVKFCAKVEPLYKNFCTRKWHIICGKMARGTPCDFFPWVVDPYGATTFTARKLVQSALTAASLTRSHTAPTAKQFLDRISAAVFRGTAAIIAEGVQRATSNHAKL